MGDPSRPLDFLLGSNSGGLWANSTLNASDISGGIINCCGTYGILPNGTVEQPVGGWNKSAGFGPVYQRYRDAGQGWMAGVVRDVELTSGVRLF